MFDYLMRHAGILVQPKKPTSADQLFGVGVPCKIYPFPTDCDYNFHVNQAKYFQYGEVARFKLLHSNNFLRSMFKRGIKPLVLAQKATYRKELKWGKPVTIYTSIVGHDKKSFFIKQRLTSKGLTHCILFVRAAMWEKNQFLDPSVFYHMLGISEADVGKLDNRLVDDWIAIENEVLLEIQQFNSQ